MEEKYGSSKKNAGQDYKPPDQIIGQQATKKVEIHICYVKEKKKIDARVFRKRT